MSIAAKQHRYSSSATVADLEHQFRSMIDKAIGAIVACEPKPDLIFGQYSELVSVARSVAFHEGKLLEWGIAAIARCNPDLTILPPDRPMPIVPAAIQLLKTNEWHEIQGVRLDSAVHATRTYTPDLFIVNRARHAGLIVDVKRSLASYAESRLDELRFRMLAVAAIASSWLLDRQGPVLVEVGTAIIDGADVASDHSKGVFKLSEIGDLLEVDEAGGAMTRLREMFAERVRQELGSQCRKALGPGKRRGIQSVDPENVDTKDALDERQDTEARRPPEGLPALPTSVRVGFARFRAGS